MLSRLLALTVFCIACLPGRCTVLPGALAAPAALGGARHGMLYRISGGGAVAYLFGTVHVGKAAFFPLAPEVTRALAGSSALVLELDLRDGASFQQALDKYGRYRAGQTILSQLPPATAGRLLAALGRAGLPLQTVLSFKPWLVANILVGVELERHGYERSKAVEYFLLAAAQQQDKAVLELESADYQLALFDSMSEAEQGQYLVETLDDLDDGKALSNSRGLVDAWSVADTTRMDALLHTLTSGNTVSASFMQVTLLGKRNTEMAGAIAAIMRQGRSAFVGVGLLHLMGERGLPQLLRQRGYRVEQVAQ